VIKLTLVPWFNDVSHTVVEPWLAMVARSHLVKGKGISS